MQGAVLPREGELIETSAWVGLPGLDAGLREGTSVERAGVSQTVWLELLFLKKKSMLFLLTLRACGSPWLDVLDVIFFPI